MTGTDIHRRREAAERIRKQYLEEVATLRADKDLSDEGRQRRLADAYVRTKTELQKHAAAEREELTNRKAQLEQRFYRTSGSHFGDAATRAISVRDASDRAAQIKTPQEAMDLLRRAESNGDEVLTRAVVRVALDRPASGIQKTDDAWDDVGRAFLDSRPDLVPVAEELGQIERLTDGKRQIFSPFSIPAPYGVAPRFINGSPEPAAAASA